MGMHNINKKTMGTNGDVFKMVESHKIWTKKRTSPMVEWRETKMAKTNLEEINRNIYDIKNKDEYDFKIKKGLTPEII